MASLAHQHLPSALACRRCRCRRHRRRWTRLADRRRPPPPSPSRRCPRRPVNLVLRPWRSDIPPLFPVGAGDTCGGIPTDKRKGRKSLFLFTAQLLRKTNLAEIFSEARSGTIAHKNKKRITAGTQYCPPFPLPNPVSSAPPPKNVGRQTDWYNDRKNSFPNLYPNST
jgi:hypothetical protein